ncbi:MAG: diguanylate cyclase [Acidobacteria bacterium]|nr:diguanylate cyclase [Acidobacteriota bacterium]
MPGNVPAAAPETLDRDRKRHRILIVDDDPETIDLLTQWFRMDGYEVQSLRSGREAVDLVRTSPPDLVLLDLLLPDLDGIQVTRALREDPRSRGVSIVVMTARRNPEGKVEALRVGADDFITKPFNFDELDATVRASLQKRVLHLALEQANQDLRAANERLTRLSETDDRTRLYNDRYLRRRIAEEFKRSHRYGTDLSCMILDLDHFKEVNDAHGHEAGNDILTGFGQILVANAREIDVVGRYGGEEFLVLLPNTDGIRATVLGERIRRATEAHAFQFAEAQVRMTVSAGIASYPTNRSVKDENEFVRAADAALYRAKQRGRNKVILDKASLPQSVLDGDLSAILTASLEELHRNRRGRPPFPDAG